MNQFTKLFVITLLFIVLGFSGSQAITNPSWLLTNTLTFATYTVNIVGIAGANSYSPDTITINPGDAIVWHNVDANTHSATCGTGTPCGTWDTGLFGPGFSAPISNFATGTTHYYCTFHGDGPAGMFGAVIERTTDVSDWMLMATPGEDTKVSPKSGPFGIVFVSQNDSTPYTKTPVVEAKNIMSTNQETGTGVASCCQLTPQTMHNH